MNEIKPQNSERDEVEVNETNTIATQKKSLLLCNVFALTNILRQSIMERKMQ